MFSEHHKCDVQELWLLKISRLRVDKSSPRLTLERRKDEFNDYTLYIDCKIINSSFALI